MIYTHPNYRSLLRSFAYARIIAESEHRGSRNLLKIFHIEPVYEAHEIFHHLLHTITDTLSSERGPPVRALFFSLQVSSKHVSVLQLVDLHIPSRSSSPTQAGQEQMDHNIPVLQEISPSDVSVSDSEDGLPPCFALSVLQTDIIASISNLQVESGGDMETGVHIISIVHEIQSLHPNITIPEFL